MSPKGRVPARFRRSPRLEAVLAVVGGEDEGVPHRGERLGEERARRGGGRDQDVEAAVPRLPQSAPVSSL